MRHIARRSTSVLAATASLAAFLAAACSKPKPVMQVPEVTVAPALDRSVTDWDEFTGHFEAVQSVDVRPRVSGFIQHVSFPEGSIVKQGDVLVTIDPRPYEAEVARATAVLEQAKRMHSWRSRSSIAPAAWSARRQSRVRSSTPARVV